MGAGGIEAERGEGREERGERREERASDIEMKETFWGVGDGDGDGDGDGEIKGEESREERGGNRE